MKTKSRRVYPHMSPFIINSTADKLENLFQAGEVFAEVDNNLRRNIACTFPNWTIDLKSPAKMFVEILCATTCIRKKIATDKDIADLINEARICAAALTEIIDFAAKTSAKKPPIGKKQLKHALRSSAIQCRFQQDRLRTVHVAIRTAMRMGDRN